MARKSKKIKEKGTVFVGLSGGVDSSVSAAILKKQGYDVVGVFIKVWSPDFLECTWRDERRDAMRVAAHLGIPFLTLDLEDVYKKEVADYMIREYKNGRTPNPDVMCNKNVKFGAFLKYALDMGANYVATGHYAVNLYDRESKRYSLAEGKDPEKDQSYFLWTLRQKELSHTLFPVGHLKKTHVRALAGKFGLPTEKKKDSQGVCFLGKLDMKEFLSHYIKKRRGKVFDEAGREIGYHDGAVFYTLGERHGFTVTKKTTHDLPYYIIGKDLKNNSITVSQDPKKAFSQTENELKKEIELEEVNWISGNIPKQGAKIRARLRYRQKLEECQVVSADKSTAVLRFKNPQFSASEGQSLVAYDSKGVCLGGGIIS